MRRPGGRPNAAGNRVRPAELINRVSGGVENGASNRRKGAAAVSLSCTSSGRYEEQTGHAQTENRAREPLFAAALEN